MDGLVSIPFMRSIVRQKGIVFECQRQPYCPLDDYHWSFADFPPYATDEKICPFPLSMIMNRGHIYTMNAVRMVGRLYYTTVAQDHAAC